MPIEFTCDCGKALKVPDEHAGKRGKCPACKNPVQIPAAPPPEIDAAEDAAFNALNSQTESIALPERNWDKTAHERPVDMPRPTAGDSPNKPKAPNPKPVGKPGKSVRFIAIIGVAVVVVGALIAIGIAILGR